MKMIQAIPVLHVSSSKTAEEFYCNKLGFQKHSAYHFDESKADPCYMVLSRDKAWIHLSSFSGDAVPGGVVYLLVDHVDAIYEELIQKNVAIHLKPTNQTWGNREMYVKDADGNSLRFTQELNL
jgi:uncharacterized glyoxalase superfamily protein PhnB